jgi:hypothetical protein
MTEETIIEQVDQEKSYTEEFAVKGSDLMDKVKQLYREGNIRRLTLRSESGRVLLELPLTLGLAGAVVGAVVAPIFTTIALLAAVVTKLYVTVERQEGLDGDGQN